MLDLCLIMLPNPALSNPKMYYNLGLLYIASVTEKAGYSVEMLDCRGGWKSFPEARYYGFSATTPEIPYAKKFSKGLKGKTIIGGAHASLSPQDCLGHFDFVVVGEGERVILDIMSGRMKYPIVTGMRIQDLDEIPFPTWDKIEDPFSDTLFAGEKYGTSPKAASLISSRGCPFLCAFCANVYWAPIVYRGVDNIIQELKELMDRGVYHFRFEDDNLPIHPALPRLSEELKKLDIRYKCHIRSDLVTWEKAKLLADSGCEECGLGVESADDKVLNINNKKETSKDHRNAIRILKAAHIRAKTYFVMGLPGETDKTLELNKEFIREMKPEKWTISTFTPYPGCDIYKNPAKYNIEIIDNDWAHWWNFCDEMSRYNHLINGQTPEQMWNRYKEFYKFMKEESWK